MATADFLPQRSAFEVPEEDPDLDPTPRPDELPGGAVHAEHLRRAEAIGGRHWNNATPDERNIIATRAAVADRRVRAQVRAAGFATIDEFLAATDEPPELTLIAGKRVDLIQAADYDGEAWAAGMEREDNWSGYRSLADIDRSPPPPLLVDRLDPAGHTILYGTGGVGKGTLATYWATQLVRAGHKVLILDYEHHPEEWARRYFGLAGLEGSSDVVHVSPLAPSFTGPHGPLWQTSRHMFGLCAELDVSYVIVDSIVPACGGADPMEPGTPARYAAAIQELGVPVLSLAHVTKADDLRFPYGSVFWHNLARLTWSMAKDGDRILLASRKANNYPNLGRSLLTITYRDELPVDVLDQPYTVVLADRIAEVLAESPRNVSAIVRELNDRDDGQPVKADSVRAALRRGLKADPKRYTVDGTGDGATWSLP